MKIQAVLINRAARAFMNTVNIDIIPNCIGELSKVNDLLEKNREFRGFIMNPLFTADERERVLKVLKERIGLSDETMRFLSYLLEEKAMAGLPDIIKKVTLLYLDKKRKAKAIIVTPVALDSKYDERLKNSLKNLTGREIDIDYVIDPAILGGIVIKVGSTMYDSSIRGQLRLLKDNLIKGELS